MSAVPDVPDVPDSFFQLIFFFLRSSRNIGNNPTPEHDSNLAMLPKPDHRHAILKMQFPASAEMEWRTQ